ncbi:unnamed protein product [Litomosoides sigmodontis]|uniref:Uncharacterized protein n=1 Tax=Litomosoides sigmodontis TaxID=42156 RepID=A0A3P6UEV4_LITSI|nr:unnamed protein product [Litomosoides sigmodontis]
MLRYVNPTTLQLDLQVNPAINNTWFFLILRSNQVLFPSDECERMNVTNRNPQDHKHEIFREECLITKSVKAKSQYYSCCYSSENSLIATNDLRTPKIRIDQERLMLLVALLLSGGRGD